MDLQQCFAERERVLSSRLREKQAGIDDRTGKGMATENIVEELVLRPFLPPGFDCGKGAIISGDNPTVQSQAIDRVIFDRRASTPLVYDPSHSIFPIEAVAGMVEITMHLDAKKLRTDIERMIDVKAMTTRNYLIPKPGSRTKTIRHTQRHFVSPRSFIVGLPADPKWNPKLIASTLRKIQLQFGPPTHVHGLYVIGIGLFSTIAIENNEEAYRIATWTSVDRIFRFSDQFRHAFDRWRPLKTNWSVDLDCYAPGDPTFLVE
jgi:hypothetical protein